MQEPTRYQVLPTEEQWKEIEKNILDKGSRIVLIDQTNWHNALTRLKQNVNNIPIFAKEENSDRIMAVTEITEYKTLSLEEFNSRNYEGYTYEQNNAYPINTYVFHKYYTHTNFNRDTSNYKIVLSPPGTISKHFYIIQGQTICCPITARHLFRASDDLKKFILIMKGQLMGQNGNSPFQHPDSVNNSYTDYPLKDMYGSLLKSKANPLTLLFKNNSNDYIQQQYRTEEGLQKIPRTENQVAVKMCTKREYTIVTKAKAEELKDTQQLSNYYPTIYYENIADAIDTIPRIPFDLACCGLGSAGTGILDQLSRSTYITNAVFCDFDTVETKNLRNQWYNRFDQGTYKAAASTELIAKISPNITKTSQISIHNKPFQEVLWENYSFKYVISGFDSIPVRLELLEYIKTGKIETKYLIDVRYADLTASVYFVDVNNAEELDYYEKGLLSDNEAFNNIKKETQIDTWEKFYAYLEHREIFEHGCGTLMTKIKMETNNTIGCCPCTVCRSTECLEQWKEIYTANAEWIKKHITLEENSCLKQNFIDIYKYASSYVFAAVREIEADEPKPFTHIDCVTEKIPRHILLRK